MQAKIINLFLKGISLQKFKKNNLWTLLFIISQSIGTNCHFNNEKKPNQKSHLFQ